MDTDRIVLGVDVGGTKIRYGLMDMEGTVLADNQCRSRAMPCREWFSFITEKLDSCPGTCARQSACFTCSNGKNTAGESRASHRTWNSGIYRSPEPAFKVVVGGSAGWL